MFDPDLTGFGALRGQRVAVAMSGGVDSSVVAALAAASGCEVVGVTLQLYVSGAAAARPGACCAGADIRDARGVAERLGIAHYVIDMEARFRDAVITAFADSYARGQTPVPCVECNKTVKFTDLLALARELDCTALLTGHYVQRIDGSDGPELHRGADPAKDQSYFLWTTTRRQLDYLRFPLGGLSKPEVRRAAEHFGLAVAAKPDSQDICFVGGGDYAAIVERLRPELATPGDIVDLGGRVIGRHAGIHRFTVGQRRGLDIGGAPEPLYVVRIDAAANRVVAGPRAALAVTSARVEDCNALGALDGPLMVKVRSLAAPAPARWYGDRIVFDTPLFGVAPGQAAVAYRGSRLVAGAMIAATEGAVAGTDRLASVF
ncbi:tRNA 2-thiouridine(34) synthase MnmA [Polymorphobacter fuscus]|uniref:tRNA-specific 2-thiouridylase MnmA n=1 Tax=Sandarakinorhabdus fusca TaxID=1439888 RepID=A0A7C9GV18_9SPHN|nr:tRNA 2-thiouridine(34) synthase MnmA [Polymorphobacter fuscus]KAB7649040.1 tRNA 2-thiouridine(34) synthase MnmA [Polymorphobacter fuscus]MQT15834.1 tRNA 2-thiouridine(34) synthase MnmA [Polymorphobacter fuscus]